MMLLVVEQRKWGSAPTFGPRQWMRQRLLLKELSRLERGDLLDAGCGPGRIERMLSGSSLSRFAFDRSQEGVAAAAGENAGASFFIGAINAMPLARDSFEAVVSGDVLEHIEDDAGAAAEIFRVLKPGGLAVVSVPADPQKWSIDDEWSGHKRRYEKEQLRTLFARAGFKTVACYYWGWPVTWIYYRLLYIPMLKRRLKPSDNNAEIQGLSGANWLELLFKLLFLPDLMLLDTKFGIGLIAVFEKPQTSRS
jgi:SAM-dependent methyltransferase